MSTLSPVTPSAQLRIGISCSCPATVRAVAVGEIDLTTAHMLHDGLFSALYTQAPDFLDVDLAGVTFMDCIGLGVLVAMRRAAARTGCQLRVVNPQPIVRRVLALTGLLGILAAPSSTPPLVPVRSEVPSGIGPTPEAVTPSFDLPVAA
ncbi:STAS domain-containing protein [Dactylosporangium roseum]|uniref:Anti-sigma factor antagonist n=1 Tax=Dactylosporangium roseum TaxID=47989 RepID=A0ABY5ZF99_9ACTN|nr:STAS domain-containing protein [Dactylosporangium roseum]UWZ39630.1 STAS domain-containing protein [Dactylosporangium roseum]